MFRILSWSPLYIETTTPFQDNGVTAASKHIVVVVVVVVVVVYSEKDLAWLSN